MVNTVWVTTTVVTAVIVAVVSIIAFQRKIRRKKLRYLHHEERTFSQNFLTLGSSLIVLGIVFGTDRLIGYSFIGAGVLLSLISAIKSKKKIKKQWGK